MKMACIRTLKAEFAVLTVRQNNSLSGKHKWSIYVNSCFNRNFLQNCKVNAKLLSEYGLLLICKNSEYSSYKTYVTTLMSGEFPRITNRFKVNDISPLESYKSLFDDDEDALKVVKNFQKKVKGEILVLDLQRFDNWEKIKEINVGANSDKKSKKKK